MDIETVTHIFRRNMTQLVAESAARRRSSSMHLVARPGVRAPGPILPQP